MPRTPYTLCLALTLCVLATAGCSGDGPTAPIDRSGPQRPQVPGTLVFSIEGARADDRAVLLRVSGIAAPMQLAQATLTLHTVTATTGTSLALFGEIGSGELLRVAIADIAAPPSHATQILEVSDAKGTLRPDTVLATYRVTSAVRRN